MRNKDTDGYCQELLPGLATRELPMMGIPDPNNGHQAPQAASSLVAQPKAIAMGMSDPNDGHITSQTVAFDWAQQYLACTTNGIDTFIVRDLEELRAKGFLHFVTERSSWANRRPQRIIDEVIKPVQDAGGSLLWVHQRMVGRRRRNMYGAKDSKTSAAKKLEDRDDALVIYQLFKEGHTTLPKLEVLHDAPEVVEARETYIWWSKAQWKDPEFIRIWKAVPYRAIYPDLSKALVALCYLASSVTENREEFERVIGTYESGYANVFRANWMRNMHGSCHERMIKGSLKPPRMTPSEFRKLTRKLGNWFNKWDMGITTSTRGDIISQFDFTSDI